MSTTSPQATPQLPVTDRTRMTRLRERAVDDRAAMLEFLAGQLVAHVGLVRDGAPVVLPSTYAVDPAGPDDGGTLYLHGSVAASWLREAPSVPVCVTVTALDGLVLARSGFHHSMNYRSAVVHGDARLVSDVAERDRALDRIVDQVCPGRSATLRANTRKELVATTVLAVGLAEASYKQRAAGVGDDPEDVAAGVWAGVLPLHTVAGALEPDTDVPPDVPAHVLARVSAFAPPPM